MAGAVPRNLELLPRDSGGAMPGAGGRIGADLHWRLDDLAAATRDPDGDP